VTNREQGRTAFLVNGHSLSERRAMALYQGMRARQEGAGSLSRGERRLGSGSTCCPRAGSSMSTVLMAWVSRSIWQHNRWHDMTTPWGQESSGYHKVGVFFFFFPPFLLGFFFVSDGIFGFFSQLLHDSFLGLLCSIMAYSAREHTALLLLPAGAQRQASGIPAAHQCRRASCT